MVQCVIDVQWHIYVYWALDSNVTLGAFYCDYVPLNPGTISLCLYSLYLSYLLTEWRTSWFSPARITGSNSEVCYLVK